MNLPSTRQWSQFFSVLSKKQRRMYVLFFVLFVISSVYLLFYYYHANTSVYPDFGGLYKEGLIGQPRFVNPLYLSDNDSDRDLVEILFSSLLKHNENGEIVNDLAKEYSIENNGKDYIFQIHQDIVWHDGRPLTAEDIVFTIELVQSPQYKSPLRVEWLGVRIEEKGERDIIFRLQKPYASFLETISRLKILPKHIFQDISPDNFPWILTAKQYLVGTGPFKVKDIKQDKSDAIKRIEMERNEDYYGQKPYLKNISLYFYQSLDELIKGGRTGEIDGFSVSDPKYVQLLEKEGFNLQRINLPRYFALFFNLGSKTLNNDAGLTTVEIYDALTDTWTKGVDMLSPRWHSSAGVVGGKIYDISGYSAFRILTAVEEFDTGFISKSVDPTGKLPTEWGKIKS